MTAPDLAPFLALPEVADAQTRHQAQVATWAYTPLVVRAHLATALAITRPADISLPGILAKAVMERLFHFNEVLPPAHEVYAHFRIPLAVQGPDAPVLESAPSATLLPILDYLTLKWWWYACSEMRLEGKQVRDTQYWSKRLDTAPWLSNFLDFGGRREKIVVEQGQFKAYHQPLQTLTCNSITWHCVGDAEGIRELLAGAPFIGKKRSQGFGEVMTWEVELAEQDESLWHADGTLARPIPLLAFQDMYKAEMEQSRVQVLSIQEVAFRAPQWAAYNQTVCVTEAHKEGSEDHD